jgi:Short C-terminal domain
MRIFDSSHLNSSFGRSVIDLKRQSVSGRIDAHRRSSSVSDDERFRRGRILGSDFNRSSERIVMPLFRRRPLLRAAAVGGGAYAMGKHRANQQAEQQQEAYYEGQQSAMAQAPPAPPAAPPQPRGITAEDTARLQELGKLHEQGILTDEEFSAQKAAILGLS